MADETLLSERGPAPINDQGAGPLPGRQRKPPAGEKIAQRVAKLQRDCPPAVPCCIEEADAKPRRVQPLNPGFFVLEQIRAQSIAKTKGKRKAKARSK